MRDRLKEAIDPTSFADFAKELGVDSQTVNNWLARKSVPKKYIKRVESITNRFVEYLESGNLPKFKNDLNTTPASVNNRTFGMVPLISWIEAGEWHMAEMPDDSGGINMIECHKPHSKGTYALKVSGHSMTAPQGSPYTFPEGCIIIVDPDQKGDTADGIFVVAKENGMDSVTFKQLKYDGTLPYLNPLNNDYPKIFNEFRIIGKVIDALLPQLP